MKAEYLILDVDGTLTDGKIYMGADGELFKAFDIKDGCGIYDIFPKYGGKTIIITARNSEIVKRRCEELKIEFLYQGVRNKAEKLAELAEMFGFEKDSEGIYQNVAYMGDDIIDLPIMRLCRYKGAPNNASAEVLEIANFISSKNGGDGAVREFIEFLCDIPHVEK